MAAAFDTMFEELHGFITSEVAVMTKNVTEKVSALATISRDHEGRIRQNTTDNQANAKSIAHLLNEAEKGKQGVIAVGGLTEEDKAKLEQRLDDLLAAVDSRLNTIRQRIEALEDTVTKPPIEVPTAPPQLGVAEPQTPPALAPGRSRSSPVMRVPRDVAEARVIDWWSDGGWHTVDAIAAKHSQRGTANYRYLRGNMTTVCRELYDRGVMQRKDHRQAGSNYAYKLSKPPKKTQGGKKGDTQ